MVSTGEKWLCNLIGGLEENVNDETLKKVLENCGRKCQTQSMIKKAKTIYEKSKDVDTFLAEFGKTYKHLHREKQGTYLVYPKCYCTRVNKIPQGQMPAVYCNCSVGWAKALFEGALGKPVDVTLEKSIIAGDNECRFEIGL
jgi:predicted ArsR family transcriptional regulator